MSSSRNWVFSVAERRVILGSAVGMVGGFAVTFSATFGLFLKPIGATLGLGRADVSLLATAGFLGTALGAPILGPVYDRLGARRVLPVGMAMFAIALGLLGLAGLSLWPMVAMCLLLGFAGATTAPSGYVLILSKTIVNRLGLAMGLAMLGVGIGFVTMPLLAERLIATYGWRYTYAALAAFALVTGAIAVVLVGRLPKNGANHLAPVGEGVTLGTALTSWRFWLIAVHAFVVGAAGFGTSAHFIAVVTDHGLTPAAAASGAALVGAGVFAARIGSALLLDYVHAPVVAAVACALGACGLLLLPTVDVAHHARLPFISILIGLLVGSEGDTLPYLARRYFGTRSFGAVFGWIIGIGGLGGVAGPLVLGYAFDRVGVYDQILLIAATIVAASGLSLLLLGKYSRFSTSQHESRS